METPKKQRKFTVRVRQPSVKQASNNTSSESALKTDLSSQQPNRSGNASDGSAVGIKTSTETVVQSKTSEVDVENNVIPIRPAAKSTNEEKDETEIGSKTDELHEPSSTNEENKETQIVSETNQLYELAAVTTDEEKKDAESASIEPVAIEEEGQPCSGLNDNGQDLSAAVPENTKDELEEGEIPSSDESESDKTKQNSTAAVVTQADQNEAVEAPDSTKDIILDTNSPSKTSGPVVDRGTSSTNSSFEIPADFRDDALLQLIGDYHSLGDEQIVSGLEPANFFDDESERSYSMSSNDDFGLEDHLPSKKTVFSRSSKRDSDSDGKLEIVTDEENQTGASNENIASVANAANPKVDAEDELVTVAINPKDNINATEHSNSQNHEHQLAQPDPEQEPIDYCLESSKQRSEGNVLGPAADDEGRMEAFPDEPEELERFGDEEGNEDGNENEERETRRGGKNAKHDDAKVDKKKAASDNTKGTPSKGKGKISKKEKEKITEDDEQGPAGGQKAIVHVTVCNYPERGIVPKIRTEKEKEQFYTGYNRFHMEPEVMYNLLWEATKDGPGKPLSEKVHTQMVEAAVHYQKGYTADFTSKSCDKDLEKFSHLIGAMLKPAMDMHDELVEESVYYDSEETNWESQPAIKLGLLPKVNGKEPDMYIPCAKAAYATWPKISPSNVFNAMSIARTVKLGGKDVHCFHVDEGLLLRVDVHEEILIALKAYLKTFPDDLRIDKNRRILHSWGLFAFFQGPSGDPDTILDPRLGSKITKFHQTRMDVFLDYIKLCWKPVAVRRLCATKVDLAGKYLFNRTEILRQFKRVVNHLRDMKRSAYAAKLLSRRWYTSRFRSRKQYRFKNGKTGFNMVLKDPATWRVPKRGKRKTTASDDDEAPGIEKSSMIDEECETVEEESTPHGKPRTEAEDKSVGSKTRAGGKPSTSKKGAKDKDASSSSSLGPSGSGLESGSVSSRPKKPAAEPKSSAKKKATTTVGKDPKKPQTINKKKSGGDKLFSEFDKLKPMKLKPVASKFPSMNSGKNQAERKARESSESTSATTSKRTEKRRTFRRIESSDDDVDERANKEVVKKRKDEESTPIGEASTSTRKRPLSTSSPEPESEVKRQKMRDEMRAELMNDVAKEMEEKTKKLRQELSAENQIMFQKLQDLLSKKNKEGDE